MLGGFGDAGWGETTLFDRVSFSSSILFVTLGFCLTSSCGVTDFCGEVVALPEDSVCMACLVSSGLNVVRTIGVVVTGDFDVMLMWLE